MTQRRGITIVLALLVCALAPRAGAQSTVAGGLQGAVTDQTGVAIPGATVTVASDALVAATKTAVTDGSGRYRFPSLPPGIYAVSAELSGFRPVRKDGVRVSLGQVLSVNLLLTEAHCCVLRLIHGFLRFLCKFIHIHNNPSSGCSNY